MKVYDLDLNEQIDILKIWNKEYKIWDIPPKIIKEIQNIPTKFISDENFFKKWRKIIKEILELKNDNVEMENFTTKHIKEIIKIIFNRITND